MFLKILLIYLYVGCMFKGIWASVNYVFLQPIYYFYFSELSALRCLFIGALKALSFASVASSPSNRCRHLNKQQKVPTKISALPKTSLKNQHFEYFFLYSNTKTFLSAALRSMSNCRWISAFNYTKMFMQRNVSNENKWEKENEVEKNSREENKEKLLGFVLCVQSAECKAALGVCRK